MKCRLCGKEMGNNYHDGFPLFLDREYDKRKVCEECNNTVIVPIRNITDRTVRKLQFSKCDGDWWAACRKLGENYFKKAYERVKDAATCSARHEYENMGHMYYGVNPCGNCDFYDSCRAENKGNQAQ